MLNTIENEARPFLYLVEITKEIVDNKPEMTDNEYRALLTIERVLTQYGLWEVK